MKSIQWMLLWGGYLGVVFCQEIRPYEPLVVTGAELGAAAGTAVDEWFLYAWLQGQWVMAPFQIDERDTDGSYFNADDGVWDANDELVILPQFVGDLALIGDWIADPSARSFDRVRIDVTDPVTLAIGYLYLYRSTTLNVVDWPDLVSYQPTSDQVTGSGYLVGFDSQFGFMNELRMDAGSGLGDDLVDREKFRLHATPLIFNLMFDEEDLELLSVTGIDGRVRVIRRAEGQIDPGLGGPVASNTLLFFYPEFYASPAGQIDVPASLEVESLRYSLDLSPEATGASWSDPNNTQLDVDGVPDGAVTTLQPGQLQDYWALLSWQGVHLIRLGVFAGVANQNSLYYHDNVGGGTADGTGDSGDGQSYGDMGLRFASINPGTHQVANRTLIDLAGVVDGETAQAYLNQPIQTSMSSENLQNALPQLWSLWHTTPPSHGMITVLDLVALVQP